MVLWCIRLSWLLKEAVSRCFTEIPSEIISLLVHIQKELSLTLHPEFKQTFNWWTDRDRSTSAIITCVKTFLFLMKKSLLTTKIKTAYIFKKLKTIAHPENFESLVWLRNQKSEIFHSKCLLRNLVHHWCTFLGK